MKVVKISNKKVLSFNERVLTPLEQITKDCNTIRGYEHGYQTHYYADDLDKVYRKAEKEALEIKEIYDRIISNISLIDIQQYGLLLEVLNVIEYFSPVNALSNKLERIKLIGITPEGKDTDLYNAIRQISYYNKIRDKFSEYFYQQQEQERITEIDELTKKGLTICRKYWREWYEKHIYEGYKWREKFNSEWNHNLPWEKPLHSLKIGMRIHRSGQKEKIEVLDIGQKYDMYSKYQQTMNDNDYYENSRNESIVITVIGGEDNGNIYILEPHELRVQFQEERCYGKSISKYLRQY